MNNFHIALVRLAPGDVEEWLLVVYANISDPWPPSASASYWMVPGTYQERDTCA